MLLFAIVTCLRVTTTVMYYCYVRRSFQSFQNAKTGNIYTEMKLVEQTLQREYRFGSCFCNLRRKVVKSRDNLLCLGPKSNKLEYNCTKVLLLCKVICFSCLLKVSRCSECVKNVSNRNS